MMARWLSWLERRPVTAEVVGSNPIRVAFLIYLFYTEEVESKNGFLILFYFFRERRRIEFWDLSSAGRASALQAGGHRFEPCCSHHPGPVAQLVRALACHARGRGFEPHPGRHFLCTAGASTVFDPNGARTGRLRKQQKHAGGMFLDRG